MKLKNEQKHKNFKNVFKGIVKYQNEDEKINSIRRFIETSKKWIIFVNISKFCFLNRIVIGIGE